MGKSTFNATFPTWDEHHRKLVISWWYSMGYSWDIHGMFMGGFFMIDPLVNSYIWKISHPFHDGKINELNGPFSTAVCMVYQGVQLLFGWWFECRWSRHGRQPRPRPVQFLRLWWYSHLWVRGHVKMQTWGFMKGGWNRQFHWGLWEVDSVNTQFFCCLSCLDDFLWGSCRFYIVMLVYQIVDHSIPIWPKWILLSCLVSKINDKPTIHGWRSSVHSCWRLRCFSHVEAVFP